MSKTDQQLIDEYLAKGGTITVIPFVPDKYEPPTNLIPTHQPYVYDRYGKRVYANLNKPIYSIEQDITKLNYGD